MMYYQPGACALAICHAHRTHGSTALTQFPGRAHPSKPHSQTQAVPVRAPMERTLLAAVGTLVQHCVLGLLLALLLALLLVACFRCSITCLPSPGGDVTVEFSQLAFPEVEQDSESEPAPKDVSKQAQAAAALMAWPTKQTQTPVPVSIV